MTDMRKHFESWALGQGWSVDRADDGNYRTMTTDAAWGAWMACTLESYEACAKICDQRKIVTPEWQMDQHYNQAASHCAQAIRLRGKS